MDLDLQKNILLLGLLHQGLVLGERLDHGLGGHHVQARLQGRQDDVIVRVIRGEHRAHVSRLCLGQSINVGLPVDFVTLINKTTIRLLTLSSVCSIKCLPEGIAQMIGP